MGWPDAGIIQMILTPILAVCYTETPFHPSHNVECAMIVYAPVGVRVFVCIGRGLDYYTQRQERPYNLPACCVRNSTYTLARTLYTHVELNTLDMPEKVFVNVHALL